MSDEMMFRSNIAGIRSWCVGFSRFLAFEDRLKARHQHVATGTLAKFVPFVFRSSLQTCLHLYHKYSSKGIQK